MPKDNLNDFKSDATIEIEERLANASENDRPNIEAELQQSREEDRQAIETESQNDVDQPSSRQKKLDDIANKSQQQRAGEEEDDEEEEPANLSPRQKALEDIAKHAQEERAAEDGEEEEEDDDAGEGEAAAADAAEQAAAEKVMKSDDYEIRQNDDGVDCLVLKIHGQEVLRPVKTVIAQAQKGYAADENLEKAGKAIQEARNYRERLDRRSIELDERENRIQEKLDKVKDTVTDGLSEEDVQAVKPKIKSFIEKILDDDIDGAVDAFMQAQEGRGNTATPALTEDKVREMFADIQFEQTELSHQQQQQADDQKNLEKDWNTAKSTFQAEFPEIKPGSKQWELADRYTKEVSLEKDFQGKPMVDIFREAGKRVRGFFEDTTGKPKSRQQRKRDSQQHVRQRQGTQNQKTAAEEDERTPEQKQRALVKDMRQRRRPTQPY